MRSLRAGWLLVLLAGCAGAPEHAVEHPDHGGQTLVYACGDFEFVVRSGRDQVVLYLPEETRTLRREWAPSGARYREGGLLFWRDGERAQLDLGGRRYVDCRLDPERGPWEDARRRGIDFRAVGQEPGWVLEIRHDENLLLVTDYGSRRTLVPTPEPALEVGFEQYHVPEKGLTIAIETAHCSDPMSGASYTHRVTVTQHGRVYRGCGLSLEPR